VVILGRVLTYPYSFGIVRTKGILEVIFLVFCRAVRYSDFWSKLEELRTSRPFFRKWCVLGCVNVHNNAFLRSRYQFPFRALEPVGCGTSLLPAEEGPKPLVIVEKILWYIWPLLRRKATLETSHRPAQDGLMLPRPL
jgi:hypothetical protein